MTTDALPRFLVFALMCIGAATLAHAQSFPSKLVKITAPYSSGAGPAIFMRIMADKLARVWGQQVIVDPRHGARSDEVGHWCEAILSE